MKLVSVTGLIDFIKKATINYSIDSFHLEITSGYLKSKMRKAGPVSILEFKNNCFTDLGGEAYHFWFHETNQLILPLLNLLPPDEEIEVEYIESLGIKLHYQSQTMELFFCHPEIVASLNSDGPKGDFKDILTYPLDDNFYEYYSKLKKIAPKFGKIYLGIENKNFFIKTSDAQNKFSNKLQFNLVPWPTLKKNMEFCFDFRGFNNIISVITKEVRYELELLQIDVQDEKFGMIHFMNIDRNDNKEDYYLMSMKEV